MTRWSPLDTTAEQHEMKEVLHVELKLTRRVVQQRGGLGVGGREGRCLLNVCVFSPVSQAQNVVPLGGGGSAQPSAQQASTAAWTCPE